MPQDYPTVLVAVENAELRNALVQSLHRDGFLVLEAADADGALQLVRTHSRPIQVILLSTTMNRGVLAAALRQYRPHASFLFLAEGHEEQLQDALKPDDALGKIREFFNP